MANSKNLPQSISSSTKFLFCFLSLCFTSLFDSFCFLIKVLHLFNSYRFSSVFLLSFLFFVIDDYNFYRFLHFFYFLYFFSILFTLLTLFRLFLNFFSLSIYGVSANRVLFITPFIYIVIILLKKKHFN